LFLLKNVKPKYFYNVTSERLPEICIRVMQIQIHNFEAPVFQSLLIVLRHLLLKFHITGHLKI